MSETTTGTTGPEAGTAAPAQGATPPPAQGATGDAQGATETQGQSTADLEALSRKLADLERDNRAYRQREKAREEAAKAKAASEQTEAEKLTAKVADLETRLAERIKREQEQSLRLASISAATKLGFRNPDLAYRLIASDVEYDDDGSPLNVEKLLAGLAKADPYLVAATDFGGGSRGASAASAEPDMNTLIRSAAGRT